MTYSVVPRFSCVRLYILRGRPFPSLYAHYSFKSGRTDEFLIPLCSLPPPFFFCLWPDQAPLFLVCFRSLPFPYRLLFFLYGPSATTKMFLIHFQHHFVCKSSVYIQRNIKSILKKIVYIHIDVYIARAYIYLNVDGDRGREDVLHLCIRGRLIRRSLSVWRRFNLVRKRKS